MTVKEMFVNNLWNKRAFIKLEKYPDYLTEYFENYNKYDFHFLGILFSKMHLIDTTDFEMDSILFCDNMASAVILENDYKYNKLYSTITVEYTIMDNYEMTIEETITDRIGEQTTTVNNGGKTITKEIGASHSAQNTGGNTITVANGGKTITKEIGTSHTTENRGASTIENIENVVPYEEETYYNNKKQITNDNGVTVTTDIDSKTDVDTYSATTDTTTNSGVEITMDSEAKTDTDTHSEFTDTTVNSEYVNEHTTKRHEYGDTSIRPVADVIKGEREIAYINLLKTIFYDILSECCTYEM